MSALAQDLRYSLRVIRKYPGVAGVAIVTLALGIGANTAIFSVVDAVLLRPFGFREPQRLVLVTNSFPPQGLDRIWASAAEYLDYRQRRDIFEDLGAYSGGNGVLTGAGDPVQLGGLLVSASFLQTLGVAPALGRSFQTLEEQPGHDHAVLIAHRLWMERFGSDPSVVGRSLRLDGEPFVVLGVLPADFLVPFRPTQPDWLAPLAFTARDIEDRGSRGLRLIGRLAKGVEPREAQAGMDLLAASLRRQHPEHYSEKNGYAIHVDALKEQVLGRVRPSLLVLLAGVAAMLLIAVVNVANLVLARSTARRKEVAIRAALGAGRGRLIRQFLTESVVLSTFGGALGVLVAVWAIDLLKGLAPRSLPRIGEVGIDVRVLAFTGVVSVLTGVVFGLVPALYASRLDLIDSLKQGGRTSGGPAGGPRRRTQSVLVVSQMAAALVLLAAAGLLVRSFARLQDVNPGFDPVNVLTMKVTLPSIRYSDPAKEEAFYRDALARLRAIPGAEATAVASSLPLLGTGDRGYTIENHPIEPPPDDLIRLVSPEFFRVMRIPVLKGRAFQPSDDGSAPQVLIVTDTLARRYWPGEDPIGKRIRFGPQAPWRTIVGVAGDTRNQGLEAESLGELYLPYLQPPYPGGESLFTMYFLVRTGNDPRSIAAASGHAILAIDPGLPVSDLRAMEEILAQSNAQRRFSMILLATFAAVALVLAGVGVYGVMSFAVSQRTHEMGVRAALGARRSDILRIVAAQSAKLVLAGLAIGIPASAAVARLLSNLVFGVSVTDPATFAGVSLLLVAAALVASWVPARRAARIDPIVALRCE